MRGLDQQVVDELVTLNASATTLAAQSAQLSNALSSASTRQVGGSHWKSFWQATHDYLTDCREPFPAPSAGTACPLCQQELSPEAHERIKRFEEFFRGDVERQSAEVTRKRRVLVDALAKLATAEDQIATQSPLLFSETGALDLMIGEFVKSSQLRRAALQTLAEGGSAAVPSLAADPTKSIQDWVVDVRRKAAEQRALSTAEAIAKVRTEIAELENRLLLTPKLQAVLARIEAMKRVAKLRQASTAMSTTGLSRKIGEFTENAVTAQLRARLLAELADASLEHLPVNMGARAAKGKTRVSIALDTTRKVEVRHVLSEGERRAAGIAFFFAEVGILEHDGGIVLDDPVCSLDHERRSYVARRLVEEAAKRQVVVFTHDIVFLLELQEYAEGASTACEARVVRRVGTDAGVAADTLPWIALNVSKRIGLLKNELQQLAALERKGDADKYRQAVKSWFELLREAWERAVEEKLFAGVVGRFQPAIKTLSLSSVVVTPELTSAVEKGMTNASKWTHDMAPAINKPTPKAADMAAALNDLESFVSQFNKPKKGK